MEPNEPVEPNKPETPNKPDDSGVLGENNKPGNNGNKPNDSGVLGSNNKPNHPSGSQGNNSAPQTGDLGVNAYLILALVSIVLITLVGKRKKIQDLSWKYKTKGTYLRICSFFIKRR